MNRDALRKKYLLMKLGGSVITCIEENAPSFDKLSAHAIAMELKKIAQPLIVVHGSGTFGKNVLLKHKISTDFLSTEQGDIVLDFNRQSEYLNGLLINVFDEAGLLAAPVDLHSMMLQCIDGHVSLSDISPIETLANNEVTPVIHGGIFIDIIRGFYACSGDKVLCQLAKLLKPELVIFLSDVDGVYEHYPPFFENDSPVKVVDWTFWQCMPHNYAVGIGEMHDKLEQAIISASFTDRCYITNGRVPPNIGLILDGQHVGTKVVQRDWLCK